jgi:hypothetical protein
VVIDKMNKRGIWQGIFAPSTVVIAIIFLLNNITVQGVAFFTPTIISAIYPKKTTVQKQLQTVPPYIVGAAFTVIVSTECFDRYDMTKKNERKKINDFNVITVPIPFYETEAPWSNHDGGSSPHDGRIHHVPGQPQPTGPVRSYILDHDGSVPLRSL